VVEGSGLAEFREPVEARQDLLAGRRWQAEDRAGDPGCLQRIQFLAVGRREEE